MTLIRTPLIAAGLLLAASGAAQAAVATNQVAVSALVLKACAVIADPLAFGVYTPGSGAITATSTISLRCTNGTAYTVALNGGTTTGGTVRQRLMADGANTLRYNLYTTAAHSTRFGDGTDASVTEAGTGSGFGAANVLTVYGRLPDGNVNRNAIAGNYADLVTVTVTY